jgi:predicted ATPase
VPGHTPRRSGSGPKHSHHQCLLCGGQDLDIDERAGTVQRLANLAPDTIVPTFVRAHMQQRTDGVVLVALAHPFSHTYALGLFFCHWTGQDVDQTLQRAEKVIALSTEYGFSMFQLLATMVRGWCLAVVGQPEVGIAQLQQGVSLWRSSGAEVGVPFMLTLLADAYGRAGQPEEGLKQLVEASRSMQIRNERVYETELHRIRGELLISVRDFAGAEESFREAIEVAQRQSTKLSELRAAMSMARLWRDQGKREAARDLLAPVYGWFTEAHSTRDLKEAKALLEELAS